MTHEERAALRALAEQARDVPWFDDTFGAGEWGDCVLDNRDEAQAFLTAANPAAVLALLDEVERLRVVVAECRDELYDITHSSADPADPTKMECTAVLYRKCDALVSEPPRA